MLPSLHRNNLYILKEMQVAFEIVGILVGREKHFDAQGQKPKKYASVSSQLAASITSVIILLLINRRVGS